MLQCDQSETSAMPGKKATHNGDAASQLWCTIKAAATLATAATSATATSATATQIAAAGGGRASFCLESSGWHPGICHATTSWKAASHPGGQQVFSVLFSVQLKSAYTPDTPPQVLAVLAVLAAVDKQRKATKDTKGAAECGAKGGVAFWLPFNTWVLFFNRHHCLSGAWGYAAQMAGVKHCVYVMWQSSVYATLAKEPQRGCWTQSHWIMLIQLA